MSDRLLIELGLACNNRCVFCAQRGLDGASHTDDARVRAALEQGRAAGDSSLAFVGGEPTLHDGLAGWIQLARTLGYDDVALQTNGRRWRLNGYKAGTRSSYPSSHAATAKHRRRYEDRACRWPASHTTQRYDLWPGKPLAPDRNIHMQ